MLQRAICRLLSFRLSQHVLHSHSCAHVALSLSAVCFVRRAVCLLFFSLSLPLFDFVFLVVYILHTLLDLHVLHLCYTHTLCYGIRIVRSLSRSLACASASISFTFCFFFLLLRLLLVLLLLLLLNFVGSWQGATEKNKTKISTARALPTDTTTTRHVTRSLSSTLLCAREQRQGKIGKSTTKTTTAATAAAADCGSGSDWRRD